MRAWTSIGIPVKIQSCSMRSSLAERQQSLIVGKLDPAAVCKLGAHPMPPAIIRFASNRDYRLLSICCYSRLKKSPAVIRYAPQISGHRFSLRKSACRITTCRFKKLFSLLDSFRIRAWPLIPSQPTNRDNDSHCYHCANYNGDNDKNAFSQRHVSVLQARLRSLTTEAQISLCLRVRSSLSS
jgi:hypothetical protein